MDIGYFDQVSGHTACQGIRGHYNVLPFGFLSTSKNPHHRLSSLHEGPALDGESESVLILQNSFCTVAQKSIF